MGVDFMDSDLGQASVTASAALGCMTFSPLGFIYDFKISTGDHNPMITTEHVTVIRACVGEALLKDWPMRT